MNTHRAAQPILESYPCPYFKDGRTTTVELRLPNEQPAPNYGELLARGFRRSYSFFYANRCATCSACVPLRVPVREYTFSKSERRTLRRNEDIALSLGVPYEITTEKQELFLRYSREKHNDADANTDTLFHIHTGYPRTIEMDFRLDGRLVGVGIVDETDDALSSNYFYYDPSLSKRRLGVVSLLTEIMVAMRMGKRYHYLGFVIDALSSMAYKANYRPNERLIDGEWVNGGNE